MNKRRRSGTFDTGASRHKVGRRRGAEAPWYSCNMRDVRPVCQYGTVLPLPLLVAETTRKDAYATPRSKGCCCSCCRCPRPPPCLKCALDSTAVTPATPPPSSTLVTNLRRLVFRSIFFGVLSIFADRRVNNLQKIIRERHRAVRPTPRPIRSKYLQKAQAVRTGATRHCL